MQDLTQRQRQILEWICAYVAEHNRPPTRAEIAAAFGFRSANASEQHLRALAKKGALELIEGASRGIRLHRSDSKTDFQRHSGVPVIGRVAAGQPILAAAHIEAHYSISPALFRPRADYLLRVTGMSMRDCGILDGDLLAVHKTEQAVNGQIVVARVGEEEVTVKRFYREGDIIRLKPENPDFSPIVVDLHNTTFSIEGRGVGLIRTLRSW